VFEEIIRWRNKRNKARKNSSKIYERNNEDKKFYRIKT